MRVLIAEDHDSSRRMLEAALTALGHQVEARGDGTRAWEAYEAERFPVVIADWMMPETDWMMPQMDGLELCRSVRSTSWPGNTYVILVTAKDGKANYRQAIEAGVDDVIAKPFELANALLSHGICEECAREQLALPSGQLGAR